MLIVTGTDTNVGKTIIAAALVWKLKAHYWKPLQTGTITGDDDTRTVQHLTGLPDHHFIPPLHALAAPLAPAAAAEKAGVTIETTSLLTLPAVPGALVVEGAGGLMVPVNRNTLLIDLFRAWNLPVIIVARTTLGTINHTLLTLEALRQRAIPVKGIILNGPPDTTGNRQAIEYYGGVTILGETPQQESVEVRALAERISL